MHSCRRNKRGATRAPRGEVRIISGAWRSRRIAFPASEGLRPTPDRVRETVFNWLTRTCPVRLPRPVRRQRCLRLRGLVARCCARRAGEKRLEVVAALRHNREQLKAEQADIVHADAAEYLRGPVAAFDIVFLDPPYASGLLAPASSCSKRGW